MRVAVPHDLPPEEVARRMREQQDEIGSFLPDSIARVETSWPADDRMGIAVHAMGKQVDGHIQVEDKQVVFEVNLPGALAFFEPIIAGAIRKETPKLLTKD